MALSLATFILLGTATKALAAEPIPPSPIAKTELVMNATHAGVHFTLPKGWDIYWQNPGDSGIPTTLNWTLPPGVTAGEIQWPTPERIEVSGLVNYGYHDEVTLAVPLSGNLTGPIKVKANWLVCRDICIPESATLTDILPAQRGAVHLSKAKAQLPRTDLDSAAHTSYAVNGDKVYISVWAAAMGGAIASAEWLPIDDGLILNSGKQSFELEGSELDGTTLNIIAPRGGEKLLSEWRGVLVWRETVGGPTRSALLTAKYSEVESTESLAVSSAQSNTTPPLSPHHSLLTLLLFAFLGGLILNIMPCVLPILALKALAVAKKADASRRAAARQGMAYTVGVVLSFLLIAGVMLALKASGAAIGWGFQLQNTPFVLFLGVVMLAVAANLFGMFELPVLFGAKATGIDDSSLRGSFLTGMLAVMVATPCTAPFMATAIGATLALATLPALGVFAMLGFGMASPFLLISLWPAARRVLPKPGAWMLTFKKLLALPMLATALWLFWVAASMMGTQTTRENTIPYNATTLQELRDAGTPVLIDATAAWCLTCKVNERVALHPESMQQFFREHKVQIMVADWTNNDPEITNLLASFGRNGVPLYVYYPPRGEPVLLPQILSPGIVRDAIAPK